MADMTWTLIIPTYNRREVLLRVLALALKQTVPPIQIVIVDSSDDWAETRVAAQTLMGDHPHIRLDYLQAEERSSATQRNQAVRHATGDIVVMIDDDSFLYPDYVERILDIYAADHEGILAGVNGRNVTAMPDLAAVEGLTRKESGQRSVEGLRNRVTAYRFGRWLNSKVLFQDMNALFLKYDGERKPNIPAAFADLDVTPMTFMSGHGLSVRREIALAEPLDVSLRYYAALEDLDATYRYGRHGRILRANDAKLHHFEVAGGRVKRKTVTVFQLLNVLVFVKRNAPEPERWLGTYRWMLWRRLFAEAVKDVLARRWSFPQTAGVVTAMRAWRKVWDKPVEQLDNWYPAYQREILEQL